MYRITILDVNDATLTDSTIDEPDTSFNETVWDDGALYHAGEELYIGAPTSDVSISNGSPATVTWADNGVAIGTKVVFTVTGGSLPAGITANRVYYVRTRPSKNTFTFSDTEDGRPVATTSAGSGTFHCTARVHTVYQALLGAWDAFTVADGLFTVSSLSASDSPVAPNTKVVLTDTTTLPAPFAEATVYYVRELSASAGTFRLSLTAGGDAITSTGSGSGTAGLAINYNAPPMLNPTVWGTVGSTNRWAMFDDAGGSFSRADDEIEVEITPGETFDALWIRGLDADTVEITLKHTITTYWTYSYDLTDDSMVGPWLMYRYEGPNGQVLVDLAILGLATHSNGVLTVTLTKTGSTVYCGKLRIGTSQTLGRTISQSSRDTRDFSTVSEDMRGNVRLKKGKSRRRFTVKVLIGEGMEPAEVASVTRAMEAAQGIRSVWVGSTMYQHLMCEGYPVSWNVDDTPGVLNAQFVSV